MATTSAARIPSFRFYNPLRNLPQHPAGRSREGIFSYRFGRRLIGAATDGFFRTRKTALACAREIPANGYGIADFVVVMWNPRRLAGQSGNLLAEDFLSAINPKLLAFEMKLSNWRKALMQAHRYRFFAHAAIVLLPKSNERAALKHLETFRLLRVGLWSFDQRTQQIKKHFTPRSSPPVDQRQQLRVLRLVAHTSKALPIS